MSSFWAGLWNDLSLEALVPKNDVRVAAQAKAIPTIVMSEPRTLSGMLCDKL